MKKNLFTIAAAIILLFAFAFTQQTDKSLAKVNQEQGVFIFTDSEPITSYDYIGTVKITIAVSGQYSDLRDAFIRKAKKDYPQADGLILRFKSGGTDQADAIKFK